MSSKGAVTGKTQGMSSFSTQLSHQILNWLDEGKYCKALHFFKHVLLWYLHRIPTPEPWCVQSFCLLQFRHHAVTHILVYFLQFLCCDHSNQNSLAINIPHVARRNSGQMHEEDRGTSREVQNSTSNICGDFLICTNSTDSRSFEPTTVEVSHYNNQFHRVGCQ